MTPDNFPNMIKELFILAERDGIITEDERQIIDQVEIDLKLYNSVLEKALADNIIDDEESKNLQDLRDKILKHAIETAKYDGYIIRDERDLLKKLATLIRDFRKD